MPASSATKGQEETMKKEIVNVPGISNRLKKARIPLSTAVRGGGFLFVSGLPPLDRKTGKVPIADITRQTELVLDNIKFTLEAAGSSLDKVVKCNVFVTSSAYFDEVNAVYRRYFRRNPPARVFCNVGAWAQKFDIEIECIAIA
jgi:2-iminobutanoate/2-iminopropanoate deaminase